MPLHDSSCPSAHAGTSCRQTTSGSSALTSSIISREERTPLRRQRVAVEEVPRAHEHGQVAYERVRIVLADPPAFTPAYDHELAAALARAGADVELVTSRFRFGDVPAADGYRRGRALLPAVVAALPPVAAAAAREGGGAPVRRARAHRRTRRRPPRAVARARARRAASSPSCRRRSSPRTISCRAARRRSEELWRDLLARFDRVVVHSDHGREALAALGVEAVVIPHPAFPSDPERRDDGRTVLSFGVLRPYKGLGDAIAAVRAAGDARLLVAGDPLEPVDAVPRSGRGARRRVAARLPVARGDRCRARRVDRGRLPLPARARPERRSPTRARRRRARDRLRRRRHRRAGAPLRRRARRRAGRRRTASRPPSTSS